MDVHAIKTKDKGEVKALDSSSNEEKSTMIYDYHLTHDKVRRGNFTTSEIRLC